MAKGRDKQGREEKKKKKPKKQAVDLGASLPLRHHAVGPSPASPSPAPPAESA